jgi:carboxymethylenebutenolidase
MPQTALNIKTEDGDCRSWAYRPSQGAGPWPGVILYMDGPGIRPVLFEMAQRIADAGYVVLLPDLFYRAGPYEPIEPAKLFSDPEKRAAFFGKYFASTDKTRAAKDTAAFLAWFDAQSDVKGKKIGASGYCMGGAIVLTAAARYPDRFAAAASFHGGGLATDAEDSPHKLASLIKAKVLVAGAEKDNGFPPEQCALLKQALDAAKVVNRTEIWDGALHGWTMSDIPGIYNEAAAERHIQELTALYKETLGA